MVKKDGRMALRKGMMGGGILLFLSSSQGGNKDRI